MLRHGAQFLIAIWAQTSARGLLSRDTTQGGVMFEHCNCGGLVQGVSRKKASLHYI
jgi:hypothetical protein